MPVTRTVFGVERLEDRITPDGGMSVPFEAIADNDPDDQISEAIPISKLGVGLPSFQREDEIRLPVTDSFEGQKSWSDVFAMNGKDVDMYRVLVVAGDRIRFTTVSVAGVTPWTEPATPGNPNPQPISHPLLSPNPMGLFDGAGTWLSDVPAEKGVGDAWSLATDQSHRSFRLEHTFHRSGTYYLAVSNDSNSRWFYGPRRFYYDPVTGTGDKFNPSGGQGSFGPYTFTAEYVEKDLPDLVADEIVSDGTTLTFSYHVEQAVHDGGYALQARGRPADWSHGVELHWFDAGSNDLGAIDPNSQAAKNLVRYNIEVRVWDARPLSGFARLAELGTRPQGVAAVGIVLNASRSVSESDRSNNVATTSVNGTKMSVPTGLFIRAVDSFRGDGAVPVQTVFRSSSGNISDFFSGISRRNGQAEFSDLRVREVLWIQSEDPLDSTLTKPYQPD